MSTITASRPRAAFLPFDEEEALPSRSRTRTRARTGVAWGLLPVLALLLLFATVYVSQTATGTALTYQVASLQAWKAQLSNSDQLLGQQLDQLQSAGAINLAASHMGLTPPPSWTVVSDPPSGGQDPLLPVLLALKGA
jgi:type VI protein secretion system component VasK